MIHRIGSTVGQQIKHLRIILEVDTPVITYRRVNSLALKESRTIELRIGLSFAQVGCQMIANEAAGAGDQDAQGKDPLAALATNAAIRVSTESTVG